MGIVLRPSQSADLPLFRRWLAAPHVARWWGNAAADLAEMRELQSAPWARSFVIERDNVSVGYLQAYDCHGEAENYWTHRTAPGDWGFDMFIGEPAALRRGVGTAAIGLLLQELAGIENVRRVIVDPHRRNVAAIALYEKCGFRHVTELPDHPEGGNLLLRLDVLPRGGVEVSGTL
jgi:aminoglycoside 6'-N-acetyltransferase